MDCLQQEVLPVLCVSQPVVETTLACQTILRCPVHLLSRLRLSDPLSLLELLPLEVDMSMLPLERPPVDGIDYRAIENQVRNSRLGHRAAKTVGFSNREPERRCGFIPPAGNLVKERLNPLVGVNVKIDEVNHVPNRRFSDLRAN